MKCYHTGDLTPLHKKIRHLQEYIIWRIRVFERDDYRCRDCGNKSRKLEAHHIKSFKAIKLQYKIQTLEDAIKCDELWDIENGITLCRPCHLETRDNGARKRKVVPVISVKQIAA
jgi:5-methylcytosine-specific restriction endonuclease McrA